MGENDEKPNFLPASPDAIFKSFQGKIISYCVATSMISKIVSTMHIISDKALQYGGFSSYRLVRIENKGIIHFVLKNRRKTKIKIKLTDNSKRILDWTESNFIFPNYLNRVLENGEK